MIEIESDLDRAGVTRLVRPAVVISEDITIKRVGIDSTAFKARPEGTWEWNDLRDYVVYQIEQRFGTFPRDSMKESGIFKSFLGRFGKDAPVIARFVFEIEDGRWKNAPVSITRFCKGSDPFFAQPILARITQTNWS